MGTYASILTVARAMQGNAESQTDVLAKYGLSPSVLERFGKMLDRFATME